MSNEFQVTSLMGSYFRIKANHAMGDYRFEMSKYGENPFEFDVSPDELGDLSRWLKDMCFLINSYERKS